MTRTPADQMQSIAVQISALALRVRHSKGARNGREKATSIAGGATPRGGLDEGVEVVETPLLNGHRN